MDLSGTEEGQIRAAQIAEPHTSSSHRHTNRLVGESSPYLRQHAHNPVDWYPWGEEALARSRAEDKPILLSVGYSACHWCHVMERESFEDEAIAQLMNADFVCIKVDREERPDIDDIYMAATVALNDGHGGWPMTLFLTPEQAPFFAGTYFPPADRDGGMGFASILRHFSRAWREGRDRLFQNAAALTRHLEKSADSSDPGELDASAVDLAVRALSRSFDETWGGFGAAPKFPPTMAVSLLLRHYQRTQQTHSLEMATRTLDGMAQGGIYDHIGGGFSRYSTDARWLVPHFEKMLYDNALLVRVYLEAHQATGQPHYGLVATRTLDFVLRELTAPDGGFYSALDADSEGTEGRYYVWTPDEIEAVLDSESARRFCDYYDITREGNWEGVSVPHTPQSVEWSAKRLRIETEELRVTLAEALPVVHDARRKRVGPECDTKILTAWNGLMIGAMAEGYRVIGEPRHLEAAVGAADFVLDNLRRPDGGLLRTCSGAGARADAHLDAYLEDYAYLCDGLVDLYEASGIDRFLGAARNLADRMLADFRGGSEGAFYATASNHERLIVRRRDGHDAALPNANAVAAGALLRLALHGDDARYREAAVAAIQAYGDAVLRAPRAYCRILIALEMLLEPPAEVALIGSPEDERLEALRRAVACVYLPNRAVAMGAPALAPSDEGTSRLLSGKSLVNGQPALYVCRGHACREPIVESGEVAAALAQSGRMRIEGRAHARNSTERRLHGEPTN